MKVSELGDNYRSFIFTPGEHACKTRIRYIDSVETENPSWRLWVEARGLFLAQVICSIIALPLTLIAAIATTLAVGISEGAKQGKEELIKMAKFEIVLLASIPTCLIAAFAPHSSEWFSPSDVVRTWFHDDADRRESVNDALSDLDDMIEQEREKAVGSDDAFDGYELDEGYGSEEE